MITVRAFALRILFRLHQTKSEELGETLVPLLYRHRAFLQAEIESSGEELLKEELELLD